jgi:hypothetical protein
VQRSLEREAELETLCRFCEAVLSYEDGEPLMASVARSASASLLPAAWE